ncbi:MAG: type II secretion system F family protein [Gemmatimonadaceae bacterium]|nr:type II secretion system F family protein [Gemmatimonadaceae bacterium]
MKWRYRAADAEGGWHEGDLVAASEEEATGMLRARGWWVHDLHPMESHTSRASASGAWSSRIAALWQRANGGKLQALALAMRTLATLLAAGVPLERALDFAAQDPSQDVARSTASGDTDAVRSALRAVHGAVHRGASLADAMESQTVFPAFVVSSARAAEATGSLAATFDRVAQSVERQLTVQSHVRTVLIYPMILALSSLIATIVILIFVVPQFAALVEDSGGTLPLSTRLLVGASRAFVAGGWLAVPAVIGGAVWWLRAPRSDAQRIAHAARWLRWPVSGHYVRERDTARYLDTLATALSAGVPLLHGMALARRTVGNAAMAAQLAEAEPGVRDGQTLAYALRGRLPELTLRLLEAGESGGSLAALATRAADTAAASADRQLTRVVALIEPAMILGFGGLVGFVALALLQAIYRVNAGLS